MTQIAFMFELLGGQPTQFRPGFRAGLSFGIMTPVGSITRAKRRSRMPRILKCEIDQKKGLSLS